MASAALGLETDVRQELFGHLQRLPVAFHDRWPSGQLLSRATTDLSTIRRFVGFGFVFLIANSITALVVVILLVHIQPLLGLFVLLGMAPLLVLTRKFELRYSRDARRAQDLTGDLATSVEESALGIRVIKSYGRRPQMLASFTRDASVLRGAELTKIRTLARLLGAAGRPAATLARGCRLRRSSRHRARHAQLGPTRRLPDAVPAADLADDRARLAARPDRGGGVGSATHLRGARRAADDRRSAVAKDAAVESA